MQAVRDYDLLTTLSNMFCYYITHGHVCEATLGRCMSAKCAVTCKEMNEILETLNIKYGDARVPYNYLRFENIDKFISELHGWCLERGTYAKICSYSWHEIPSKSMKYTSDGQLCVVVGNFEQYQKDVLAKYNEQLTYYYTGNR